MLSDTPSPLDEVLHEATLRGPMATLGAIEQAALGVSGVTACIATEPQPWDVSVGVQLRTGLDSLMVEMVLADVRNAIDAVRMGGTKITVDFLGCGDPP